MILAVTITNKLRNWISIALTILSTNHISTYRYALDGLQVRNAETTGSRRYSGSLAFKPGVKILWRKSYTKEKTADRQTYIQTDIHKCIPTQLQYISEDTNWSFGHWTVTYMVYYLRSTINRGNLGFECVLVTSQFIIIELINGSILL